MHDVRYGTGMWCVGEINKGSGESNRIETNRSGSRRNLEENALYYEISTVRPFFVQ